MTVVLLEILRSLMLAQDDIRKFVTLTSRLQLSGYPYKNRRKDIRDERVSVWCIVDRRVMTRRSPSNAYGAYGRVFLNVVFLVMAW